MPLLSIIIPSFNNNDLLQKCLDSVKNQSFVDYDVFVIDAKSTDGTLEYLKSLEEPFHYISEPDRGVYDAMNKGIRMSNGEWLYFLGSDDLLFDENTLLNIFGKANKDDTSLIIGKVQYDFSTSDSVFLKKNKGLFDPSWSKKLWIKNTLHHQGVFYNRRVFNVRKYDIAYKILADYDFNLKLFNCREKTQIVNQTIAISKTAGISKNYNWQLYKEEINLKSKQSSIVLKPVFYIMAGFKYLLKKIF